MRIPVRLLAIALVCTLGACDSSTPGTPPGGTPPGSDPPPTPSTDPIGGVYSATIAADDGTTLQLSLDVPQTASGAFTLGAASTGTSTVGATTYPLTVSGAGTYTPPELTLDLTLTRDTLTQTVPFTGTAGDGGAAITLRDANGAGTVFRRP